MYCYIEFKPRYLKNLKLLSIREKDLSEPLAKKKQKQKQKQNKTKNKTKQNKTKTKIKQNKNNKQQTKQKQNKRKTKQQTIEASLLSGCLSKSIFLRNQSLSNTRWFYGKKLKIGKGNLDFTVNWLSRNEMWWVQIITIICVTYVQKYC